MILTLVSKSALIKAMIRAWLRSLIGWEEVGAALKSMREYCTSLEALIQAQGKEIESLKYMKAQREAKAQARPIADWERIQAEFAANPENFKEN